MTTLTELAQKYMTDKAPAPDDQGHHYTRHYEQLLAPLREKPIVLLELGVLYGASLLMWRDWFPNATIIGVDSSLGCLVAGVDGDRVHAIEGDATDEAFLTGIAKEHGPFDIVVDDCSHEAGATIRSFEILREHMKPRGLYIVEDLLTSYPQHQYRNGGAIGYFTHLVNWMNLEEPTDGIESITFYRWLCAIQFGRND